MFSVLMLLSKGVQLILNQDIFLLLVGKNEIVLAAYAFIGLGRLVQLVDNSERQNRRGIMVITSKGISVWQVKQEDNHESC